ncbi:MAG: amidohydrolase family protein [Eudoraea sp.]|nr:amidohydrolase family protein [Eudoraea sp.]
MKEKASNKMIGFVLIFTLAIGSAQCESAQNDRSLVIEGGILINGTGSAPASGTIVVISNGRIVQVGPRTRVKMPGNSKVIDVGGATILPGFINAHVHRSYNLEKLYVWAQSGVTTVRDLAAYPPTSSYELRDSFNKDPRTARLVAAGPQMTAGFVPSGYPSSVLIYTVKQARAEAKRILKEGADQLKIMLESNLGYADRVLSEEAARAIVEIAHRHGKKVSAHVSLSRDIKKAINVGADDLAHMVIDKLPGDLINEIVEAGIYWTPTLEMWQGVLSKEYLAISLDNLSRFSKAGGKVALGSDYGGTYADFDLGMPMKEIQLMHQAGMSPSDIIVSATKNAADVCGLGSELGTLEQGKIADILVIDGDPLKDFASLNNVRLVIKSGVIIRE